MTPRKRYDIALPDGNRLELGGRTLVMATLNITPDSFADGGARMEPARALDDAVRMIDEGADIIDIGGESTRPGAEPVPADEELRRVLPVLEGLAGRVRVPISIDTYKARVAEAALDRGASIVNDISGLLYEPDMGGVAARRGAALVLMHHRGRSSDMYREATYGDVVGEVATELSQRISAAVAAGVPRDRIILDPGLGFAKRPEHSFATLAGLDRLAVLDRPILVGASRKSFLRAAIGDRPASDRFWASAAAVTAAVLGGAHLVRVHDVKEMVDVVRTADRILGAQGAQGA
ncbi:MAG TPA: dihydropteroate synthase [Vicinamibacterales bacterium]|nr:dihydropteroate synthase [Vicinamibacterales bacterium]